MKRSGHYQYRSGDQNLIADEAMAGHTAPDFRHQAFMQRIKAARSSFRYGLHPQGDSFQNRKDRQGAVRFNGRVQHFDIDVQRHGSYEAAYMEGLAKFIRSNRINGGELEVLLRRSVESFDLSALHRFQSTPSHVVVGAAGRSPVYVNRLIINNRSHTVAYKVGIGSVERRGSDGELIQIGNAEVLHAEGIHLNLRGSGYLPRSRFRNISARGPASPTMVNDLEGNFGGVAPSAAQLHLLTHPTPERVPAQQLMRRASPMGPSSGGSIKPGEPDVMANYRRNRYPEPGLAA